MSDDAPHPADWQARPTAGDLPFHESMLLLWAVYRLCDKRFDFETQALRQAKTWYKAQAIAARLIGRKAAPEQEVPF